MIIYRKQRKSNILAQLKIHQNYDGILSNLIVEDLKTDSSHNFYNFIINMKEKINRNYKKPDLGLICPSQFLHRRATPIQMLTQTEKLFSAPIEHQPSQQISVNKQFEIVETEWQKTLSPKNQTESLSKSKKFSRSLKSRKGNAEFRKYLKRTSPYIKNEMTFMRVLSGMKPVSGPTTSILNQINKHNDLNRNAAENVIMNRKQSFKVKLSKYSNRIGLKNQEKIYIFNSKDAHIRDMLHRNNWVESLEKKSAFFHLKWVYIDCLSDYDNLRQGQMYNHFKGNQEITNKNMLRKNIKKWAGSKPNIPLTFDLELSEEQSEFLKQYQLFNVYKFIDNLVKDYKLNNPKYYGRVMKNPNYFTLNKRSVKSFLMGLQFKKIAKADLFQLLLPTRMFSSLLTNQILELRTALYDFCYEMVGFIGQISKNNPVKNSLSDKIKKVENIQEFIPFGVQKVLSFDNLLAVEFIKAFEYFKRFYHTHYGIENTWIIKPTGVSRGSGITIEKEITKICANKYGKIVQKYIERPLLLQCGRKFDIRQWVLVKSFMPLEAYAFEKCYCRFSYEKYETSNFYNMYSHLTNFTINKLSYKKNSQMGQSVMSEQELAENFVEKWAQTKIKMYSQILKTLKCCQYEIVQIDQCFEVYGFDILIDEDRNPWILEVNMSPACENRSQFLNEYLKKNAEGILDFLNDEPIRYWTKLQQWHIDQQMHKQRQKSAVIIQHWWRKYHKNFNE